MAGVEGQGEQWKATEGFASRLAVCDRKELIEFAGRRMDWKGRVDAGPARTCHRSGRSWLESSLMRSDRGKDRHGLCVFRR